MSTILLGATDGLLNQDKKRAVETVIKMEEGANWKKRELKRINPFVCSNLDRMPIRHTVCSCNLIGIRKRMNNSKKNEASHLRRSPYYWQVVKSGPSQSTGMRSSILNRRFSWYP